MYIEALLIKGCFILKRGAVSRFSYYIPEYMIRF